MWKVENDEDSCHVSLQWMATNGGLNVRGATIQDANSNVERWENRLTAYVRPVLLWRRWSSVLSKPRTRSPGTLAVIAAFDRYTQTYL
jgi:hypothetical protein